MMRLLPGLSILLAASTVTSQFTGGAITIGADVPDIPPAAALPTGCTWADSAVDGGLTATLDGKNVTSTARACQAACQSDPECDYFTLSTSEGGERSCRLYEGRGAVRVASTEATTGPRTCSSECSVLYDEDCSQTRCCAHPEAVCVEMDKGNAQCRMLDDPCPPPESSSQWTCNILDSPSLSCFEANIGYGEDQLLDIQGASDIPSAAECQQLCAATEECKGFTFSFQDRGSCFLKKGSAPKLVGEGLVSGPQRCLPDELPILSQLLGEYSDLTTFVDAVRAELRDVWERMVEAEDDGSPLTILAPTNTAFASVDLAAADESLRQILLHHIISAEPALLSADVQPSTSPSTVDSMAERPLSFSRYVNGSLYVDSARVLTPDVRAKNGALHLVDRVIVPQAMTIDLSDPPVTFGEAATQTESNDLVAPSTGKASDSLIEGVVAEEEAASPAPVEDDGDDTSPAPDTDEGDDTTPAPADDETDTDRYAAAVPPAPPAAAAAAAAVAEVEAIDPDDKDIIEFHDDDEQPEPQPQPPSPSCQDASNARAVLGMECADAVARLGCDYRVTTVPPSIRGVVSDLPPLLSSTRVSTVCRSSCSACDGDTDGGRRSAAEMMREAAEGEVEVLQVRITELSLRDLTGHREVIEAFKSVLADALAQSLNVRTTDMEIIQLLGEDAIIARFTVASSALAERFEGSRVKLRTAWMDMVQNPSSPFRRQFAIDGAYPPFSIITTPELPPSNQDIQEVTLPKTTPGQPKDEQTDAVPDQADETGVIDGNRSPGSMADAASVDSKSAAAGGGKDNSVVPLWAWVLVGAGAALLLLTIPMCLLSAAKRRKGVKGKRRGGVYEARAPATTPCSDHMDGGYHHDGHVDESPRGSSCTADTATHPGNVMV